MAPTLTLEESHWAVGRRVAGLDEAGRGAWAGPVVAAAVILPPLPDLAERLAGVDDSKRLAPAVREHLAARIEAVAQVGIGQAEAAEIDTLGILAATHLAMERALAALPECPEVLLVDYLPGPLGRWSQQRLVRGESVSLSVAAASIVAKVYRDRLMADLDRAFPGYGLARHKGYGTPEHQAALAQLGPSAIHRRSWAPLRQPRLPFVTA
ncbi:MAG: ribonuclease HII [Anaerolineae bacterium]|nr:ribonuclease HII [Caldilineales bacterium]MCX7852858.1 ribonuclease HII [Caldilineales bacterium]MDW8268748.1 ribonuclease HII [Anaerolineae bacterium]